MRPNVHLAKADPPVDRQPETLEQARRQLQETQAQLQQTERVLAQSQAQLQRTETLLAQYRTQLAQTEMVLTQFQSQLHQSREELDRSQAAEQRTQQEFAQTTAQLHQIRRELERSHFQQQMAQQQMAGSQDNPQTEYQKLVWEAWYAYHSGEFQQMAQYLQRSLKLAAASRTETVLNWLEMFAHFSDAKGNAFNPHHLSALPEWQQFVSRVLTANQPVSAILVGS
jgi:multidrug efflux pump subunit AcrA (membrane-fusion protein)